MWGCQVWHIVYCINIKHTQNSVASEPTRQSKCVCTENGLHNRCCCCCMAWTAVWTGTHLGNTGVTGVSNYTPLSWDCGLVLSHSWQHLFAWVECTAMSVSDRTLDVLLDQLQDSDLPTILARIADRSEPYPMLSRYVGHDPRCCHCTKLPPCMDRTSCTGWVAAFYQYGGLAKTLCLRKLP